MHAFVLSLCLSAAAGPTASTTGNNAVAPENPLNNEIGNGPQIELDVFHLGASTGLGSTAFDALTIPEVFVGWDFDQNAVLLGLQVAVPSGGSEFIIQPTYRRYLSPLRGGEFSPFAEGSVSLDIIGGGSVNVGFGIDGGFGGEYLFTRNFGLVGKALLDFRYIPSALSGGATEAGGGNFASIGIDGILGINVHF